MMMGDQKLTVEKDTARRLEQKGDLEMLQPAHQSYDIGLNMIEYGADEAFTS